MSREVHLRGYNEKGSKDVRNRMMAKINIEFKNMRPDLRHSTEELRLERLAFCERALNLRKPLDSMRRLTDPQLERVIEALKAEKPQGALSGCGVHHFKAKEAERGVSCGPQQRGKVYHLAGPEQVWAIRRVITHLGWSKEDEEKFILSRYNRAVPEMLAPKQANALLIILFNIAASRELKEQHGDKPISRAMIRAHVPQLKKRLGIDQASVSEDDNERDS